METTIKNGVPHPEGNLPRTVFYILALL